MKWNSKEEENMNLSNDVDSSLITSGKFKNNLNKLLEKVKNI